MAEISGNSSEFPKSILPCTLTKPNLLPKNFFFFLWSRFGNQLIFDSLASLTSGNQLSLPREAAIYPAVTTTGEEEYYIQVVEINAQGGASLFSSSPVGVIVGFNFCPKDC